VLRQPAVGAIVPYGAWKKAAQCRDAFRPGRCDRDNMFVLANAGLSVRQAFGRRLQKFIKDRCAVGNPRQVVRRAVVELRDLGSALAKVDGVPKESLETRSVGVEDDVTHAVLS